MGINHGTGRVPCYSLGRMHGDRGGGRVPALNGTLLCLAGEGATAPHQRTAAHTWAPHTSDTPPQTETRFMFGKYGVNGGRIFFFKGRLKSEKNIICQKRDLCSQKATLYPKSLPQNSFWSLAFRISRYAFSLIRIGSRQNSEVSEMSIEPHPNNTLR